MKKFNLAILKNESSDDHLLWEKACLNFVDKIDFKIIDLIKPDWLNRCLEENYDFYLLRPPGLTSLFKQLYDERVYILASVLKLPVYPSLDEILIYENKRFLYSWLNANQLPHPKTNIFYQKKEALEYIESRSLPLVAKANIGGSGSGVIFLNDKSQALNYINSSFSIKGAPKRWWPNFSKGNLLGRGMHYIFEPYDISQKIDIYKARKSEIQKGFVIFQEYIPHDYEWRIVIIGDSYFAHKKMKINEKASGTTLKKYDNPPLHLFSFVKSIMDKFNFFSQAIDVFEGKNGELLINEMQCMFGQSDPYQMLVNGKPGKYIYNGGNWSFEEGDFNKNECFDLRVQHLLSILNSIR